MTNNITDQEIAAQFAAQFQRVNYVTQTFSVNLTEPVIVGNNSFRDVQVEVTTYPNSEDETEFLAKGWRTRLTASGEAHKGLPSGWADLPDEVAKAIFAKLGVQA